MCLLRPLAKINHAFKKCAAIVPEFNGIGTGTRQDREQVNKG